MGYIRVTYGALPDEPAEEEEPAEPEGPVEEPIVEEPGVPEAPAPEPTPQRTDARFYYLKDHPGNIKVTVNEAGNVVSYDDY